MHINEFEQLLDRYYADECTPEEKILVEEWLNNIAVNNRPLWQNFSTDAKQQFIDHLFSQIQSTIANKQLIIKQVHRFGNKQWFSLVAAASILLLGMAYIFWQNRTADREETAQWLTLVSEPGHQKKLQLPDGTIIWLKGGSELLYPPKFVAGTRIVKLDGEAYFEVSADETHPFTVKTHNMSTNVLGTSFNIEAFSDLNKYVVSLVEGKIAVQHTGSTTNSSPAIVNAPVILLAQETVIYDTQTGTLTKQDSPLQSPEHFKAGDLQFEQATLHEVLFRLGKTYGVEVNYNIRQAKQHRMTGNFAISQPVDEVFRSVAGTTGAKYSRTGKKVEFDLPDK